MSRDQKVMCGIKDVHPFQIKMQVCIMAERSNFAWNLKKLKITSAIFAIHCKILLLKYNALPYLPGITLSNAKNLVVLTTLTSFEIGIEFWSISRSSSISSGFTRVGQICSSTIGL